MAVAALVVIFASSANGRGHEFESKKCRGGMMVKNEHEIGINCPTERAFEFVTDLEAWNQWHGSGKAERTTPGSVDVGTVWKVTGQVQGQPITVTIEVTSYEPNRRFGIKTTSGPIQAQQVFTFEPTDGGTRLATVLELADPRMDQPAREQWEKDLLTLKELLEAPE
jgi:uncharacterized protein YndB with AHSA1/START domain